MNREETLALYAKGKEAWNKWANERLAERKRLEEAGEWVAEPDILDTLESRNKKTHIWFLKAQATFSTPAAPHEFEEDVDFSGFIFPANTWFNSAAFSGKARFNSAVFSGIAQFNSTTFKGNASFNGVTFNGFAWFNGTIFNGFSWFNKATFSGYARFNSAIFNGFAWFGNAIFSRDVRFGSAIFSENAEFSIATFNGHSSFSNTHFKHLANFSAIHTDRAFTLAGARFKNQIPNFIQAHFEEAPRLDNIELEPNVEPGGFLESLFKPLPSDVKARYQALKRLAIQAHDHENEQLFWAGELRSDRSLRKEGEWNFRPVFSAFWWGNIAYGLFSNYGRSIVRPLISWALLVCLMALIHLSAHFHSHNIWAAPQEPKDQTYLTDKEDKRDHTRLRDSRKPYSLTVSKWLTQTAFNKGTPPFELEGIGSDPCDPFWDAVHIAVKTGTIGLGWDRSKRNLYVQKYICLYGPLDKRETTPALPNHILWKEIGQMVFSAILIFLLLLGIRNNFKLK